MIHTTPFFCVIIGLITGIKLEKTMNYDVGDKGYNFKERFTPIKYVQKTDFGQPIRFGGQTYFFGHELQTLMDMAAIVKREYDETLRIELNRLELTRKLLASSWEETVTGANLEMEAMGQNPTVTPTAQEQPPVQPPTASETVKAPDVQKVQEPHKAQEAHTASKTEPKPEEGQVGRRIDAFNLYVASSRPPADSGSLSAGYSAFIQNITTGECNEIALGCGTKDFGKMNVLALCNAFESGNIPSSTKESQTVITIWSTNTFIVNMFGKNFLKYFADNGWKTKEGKEIKNKTEWQKIHAHTSHMFVKGEVAQPEDANMQHCIKLAEDAATVEYNKKFGAIPPPNYAGKK